jgi:hypothetical protein
MLKAFARITLVSLLALLTSGCFVFGFGVGRAVRVTMVAPRSISPTPQIPLIQLQYGGQSVIGIQHFYQWNTPNLSASGGGGLPPPGSSTRLSLPLGSELDILISPSSPPAALWVAELDGSGIPTQTTVLTPTSNVTPYKPSTSGKYRLQVTAEWTYENFVTYIFELEVQP